VKAVKKYRVSILDTRKTTPLWRELEKNAVRVGGGKNHRMGLFDQVFVKENHRKGDLRKLKRFPKQWVLEVRNQKEIEEALELKPTVMLLDNLSPAKLRQKVKWIRARNKRIRLEASGGVALKNVAGIAATGVDQISVGALTHSVAGLDLSLQIQG